MLIFLRQTISLGNTVLQLIYCYYSRCLYRFIITIITIIIKQGVRVPLKVVSQNITSRIIFLILVNTLLHRDSLLITFVNIISNIFSVVML